MTVECPVCGREFNRWVDLANHIKKRHPKLWDLIPCRGSRALRYAKFLDEVYRAAERLPPKFLVR